MSAFEVPSVGSKSVLLISILSAKISCLKSSSFSGKSESVVDTSPTLLAGSAFLTVDYSLAGNCLASIKLMQL